MKLNGTSIEDFGLYPLKGQSHPTPQFTNKTVKVPGVAGEYRFGTEIGSRPFHIPLGVIEQDRTTSQEKVRAFLEEVLDEQGNPKPCELRYDYEPDKYYTVYLSGNVSTNWTHEYGNASYQLVAYDPKAYAIVYADDLTWGNEELTFESHYLLGHEGSDGKTKITSPTTLNFEVDGYKFRPTIEISGSADNLTLDNGTQSFTLSNFTNADYVIDGEHYNVTKNGNNAFADLQGDFLWLNRGQNKITVTGSNLDVDVYVKFRDQYL